MNNKLKLAVRKQLESRTKVERLFRTRFRSLFLKSKATIVTALVKGHYFTKEDLQSIQLDLRKNLQLLYTRATKIGVTASHSTLHTKDSSLRIELKSNNIKISTSLPTLQSRIKERIDEEISDFVEKSRLRITSTFAIELNRLKESVLKKFGNTGVSEADLRRYLDLRYRKLVDTGANRIAVTETTRGIEKAKVIAAEELALEAIEYDEDALDEEQAELLAELGALADEGDSDAIALLFSTAGAASLLALSGITKTWVAVMDDSTREAHADADGDTVGLEDLFNVDGEDLEYPGDDSGSPGNTINCRCTVVYDIG